MATVFLVAAVQLHGGPADTCQYRRHGSAAITTAPAVNQRFPILWLVDELRLYMVRDIARDECCTQLLGFESAGLPIQRADAMAFFIIQYRAINCAGYVVE